jgi:hypothetical protein
MRASNGTAGDLLAYLDSLTRTTEAPGPSVLRSAARQVFLIVDGDEFSDLDVTALNVDEYLQRFEDRARAENRYAPRSLEAYRSRFRRAVDLYRNHLADPSWEPPLLERRARAPVAPTGSGGESRLDRDAPTGRTRTRTRTRSRPSAPGDSTVPFATYPFQLKSGEIARLYLPPRLDAGDAERLTAFIRALVVQEARVRRQGEAG